VTAVQERERIQQECWTRAIHTFGTASIFERRAESYQRLVRLPAFLGIAVPVVVGGLVLSFGTSAPNLPKILWIGGVLGVVQLILSAWALVARWDSSFAYALESAAENHRLAAQFEKLAKGPQSDLQTRFDLLDTTYQARSDLDVKQVVPPAEKRFGLRCGLLRFQRKCVECGKIPAPARPSDCSVCGK
jgi:mobilome CxxCx(11)CxxC protein